MSLKWGEPFIGCPILSPDGYYCSQAEGHDGAHSCNEWEDGELTGRDHIWGTAAGTTEPSFIDFNPEED